MILGKRVVVTGSRGIAAGIVRALDSRGISTFVIGGQAQDSERLADECGSVAGFAAIDLRDESATTSAFALAAEKLGGFTDVVGIVGGSGRVFGDGPIDQMSKSAWEQTLELNLTTAFLTAREAIKHFQNSGGGSVTLTSSVLATSPAPEFFLTHAYPVSKGAINSLVVALAAAYLKDNIRVNAVAPGLVATPMAARAAENPAIAAFTREKQPLQREQLPVTALVSAYLYLLENENVTGQVLTVDGGWSSVTNV